LARGNCTFRQRDIKAAIKAVMAAGVDIARVEVDKDGKIIVVTGKADHVPGERTEGSNPWDNI
jgi:hypothetical protein